MRAIVPVAVVLGLTACAAPQTVPPPVNPQRVDHPPPGAGVDPRDVVVELGEDCAVIAAVARDHYRFNTTDNLPPPLWLDDEGKGDWSPGCDWSRHGLSFPAAFDPDDRPAPRRVQWVSFKRPRYDSMGAVIETGILHGPLAGMGYECRVFSGFNGWTAGGCRNTWIS